MSQDPWATATSYGVASGSGTFSSAVTESLAQLEALWISAGGDPNQAQTAAGVAIAESGGNPTAYNATQATGDQSFGLWQINVAPNANHQWASQVTAQDATSIFNPEQNAEDAVAVYNAQGWARGWGGYGTAAQQQATANAPSPTSAAVTSATPTPAPATPLQGIPGAVTGAIGGAANAAGNAVSNAVGGAASGALGTLQTSWANFWSTHPATVIVAGIVLLLVAVALLAGGGGSQVNVTAPAAAAA